MRNLLSAYFARLRRDKFFWLCMALSFAFSAVNMLAFLRRAAAHPSDYTSMDGAYFSILPCLGFLTGAFSALFFGTEYSDGTIRNKLIAGHSREAVYFAGLIISAAASLLMALAILLGGLIGLTQFGGFSMGWGGYALCSAVFLASALSVTALLTALQMAVSNRAVSVVVSFAVLLGLLYIASYFYGGLNEPEMQSGVVLTEKGMEITDPEPNPNYISGATRQVFTALLLANPLGQQMLLSNVELTNPAAAILCSVALAVLCSLCGLLVFRKKDIK